jgi:endonuclease YncB( thermonuclease family)
LVVTVTSVIVAITGCAPAPAAAPPNGPNATVLAIIDGDTIDADIGGRRERVRLLGIDTPEVAHAATSGRAAGDEECFGNEATAFTRSLIPPGTQIRLERDIVGRDHYDRVLAHVHVGELYVNGEIVRRGFATPLFIEPNEVHRALIVAAAKAAEADDVGLWARCT